MRGDIFIKKNIYSEDFFHGKILGIGLFDDLPLEVDKIDSYDVFEIIVNSKKRQINAIKKQSKLYNLQKKFLDNFLNDIPLPNYVFGFVKGRNYLDFLLPHCSKQYYLRIDIKSFFESLSEKLVRETFSEYIDIKKVEEKNKVLDEIVYITTLSNSLPQGGITSPTISNILLRRIDIRIKKYCEKYDVEYTRYADDMLFSSNKTDITQFFFIGTIKEILSNLGLKINSKKIIKAQNKLVLNGYVISKKISLSRSKMRNINSLLYTFEFENGVAKFPNSFEEFISRLDVVRPDVIKEYKNQSSLRIKLINYLAGYRAFLLSFNKLSKKEFISDYTKKIKRIEKMLEFLSDTY